MKRDTWTEAIMDQTRHIIGYVVGALLGGFIGPHVRVVWRRMPDQPSAPVWELGFTEPDDASEAAGRGWGDQPWQKVAVQVDLGVLGTPSARRASHIIALVLIERVLAGVARPGHVDDDDPCVIDELLDIHNYINERTTVMATISNMAGALSQMLDAARRRGVKPRMKVGISLDEVAFELGGQELDSMPEGSIREAIDRGVQELVDQWKNQTSGASAWSAETQREDGGTDAGDADQGAAQALDSSESAAGATDGPGQPDHGSPGEPNANGDVRNTETGEPSST